jgi:uracil-DNA glycosylase family 4
MHGADVSGPNPDIDAPGASRALLAFWRAAGVDMDEAEAIFARGPVAAPGASAAKPALGKAAAPGSRKRVLTSDAPVADAKALAAAANSVAQLRAAVESYGGCALKATARTTVFSDGPDDARVLLIGEAPGKEEDEQGKPFVGRSGQLLDRMLAAIGLDRRENLLISNTIYWRPPGTRPPTQGEIAACLPFVDRLIELVRPEVLILAGGTAAQIVLRREEGVMRMRGKKLSYAREGQQPVNAMVMLHPAYLLRRPQEKKLAWGDLLLLEAWLDQLKVSRAQTP